MQLNERWIWLGERVPPAELGLRIYLAHPGCWWLVTGNEMSGPFDDRSVLRAVRAACTPTLDGCELGPTRPGLAALPKQPVRKGPGWTEVSERAVPSSVTVYSAHALQPVTGCCTTFESLPKVSWDESLQPQVYGLAPARSGRLLADWNAHPTGLLLFAMDEERLDKGFAIVDS